jgi:glycosyltransferase involved in cell wall biosynthesis
MLEREIAVYRRLRERSVQTAMVTYGGSSDLDHGVKLGDIRVLCNRWRLPQTVYERMLPFLHGRWLSGASVIKTNQINGADVALRAARLWRKPLVVRCGYIWSALAMQGGSGRASEAIRAIGLERKVFGAAHRIVVTTPVMARDVESRHGVSPRKIRVIPNYVLTDPFCPDGTAPIENRLCFVGRLSEEKNPMSLVRALAGLAVDLVLIGEGPLRNVLERLAADLGVRARFLGSRPHLELPGILRQCAIFLLVSPHEGHPKSLLEAMACGLPVIGADAPGIRELIRHGENGWLCGTDPESIRTAVQELLARPQLRALLGRNARDHVLENFSLERILDLERSMLREVAAG